MLSRYVELISTMQSKIKELNPTSISRDLNDDNIIDHLLFVLMNTLYSERHYVYE